ncbi:STRUBBELIG-receptor family 5 [Hibiscus trionum]|uniref:STRUBBELIG-receptor family 5 n=1 Tax=Hibiscus trionum TaxID=183268 RepID=A0A9W7LQC1_HIBTR|nr:STRUBBELIG-receptor family 5 [Hibiscus trionum]
MHDLVGRCLLLFLGTLISLVHSKTDSPDVSALNVMFKSLNKPSQLRGWQSSGGDPCGDSWEGIKCSDSSVTEINLSGHDLSGQLGYQLSSLSSVKIFDVSKNNLNGDIPYQLPPNAQSIDLSENNFDGNVPYSISQMTNLEEINLSHNQLKGQLSDMFAKVQKLKSFDVSNNQLSDKLPNSLANLSNLNTLHLQNNRFTGTINVLADLPLNDLNVENNKFTGWIPDELKGIDELKTGGNSWSTGTAPPPPPGVHHRRRPNKQEENSEGSTRSLQMGLIIGFSCLGGICLLLFLMFVFTRRRSPPPSTHFLDEDVISRRKGFTPLHSQELGTESYVSILKEPKDSKSTDPGNSDMKSLLKSPSMGLRRSVSSRVSFSENEFANRLKGRKSTSVQVVPYSLADLQKYTDNFSPDRLLGEGTIGRVYKAKYPEGKVLAVKKIDSSLFQGQKPDDFSKLVANISKLHHPNIAELVGYCSEQGHNILIYDYFRNGSLYEFLHVADDFSKPLTWNTRVRIALGLARAVEYLHDVCSPSMVHKNIKSSNIFLDLELNPRLSDYGMSCFHQRTSQNLGMGYNAPECIKPSAYTSKSDVYSFGVVMLELLTGRMPVDNQRPRSEQCLVKWARPLLHDHDALLGMVDPALRGLYPPKSLPPFADVVSLCVQTEPEPRAPISEVVQALVRLVQQSTLNMKEDLSSSCRTTDTEYELV